MGGLVPLGQIAGNNGLIIDGDWVESKDQDPDGEVRLVQLADIGVGSFLDKSNRFMTAEKAVKLKCTYLKEGDILVARMPDPLGRACQFPGDHRKCVTVVDVCILRPDATVADAAYVTHILNSDGVRRQLEKYIKGTTRQRISRTNLEQIRIPLPPLPEQRRIASILDQADALRAKRRETLAQLDSLTQSIFIEMFGDPIANPKGWPTQPLASLSERIQIGPFGSQLHEEDYIEHGIPLVNPTHIKGGKIYPDWCLTVPDSKYHQLSQYHLAEGDLIIGRRGEMGRCAVITDAEQGWLCGTGSLFVRPNTALLHPIYLGHVVSSTSMRKYLENVAQGVTMANLNKDIVGALPIPVALIRQQEKFAESLAELKTLRDSHNQAAKGSDVLFASLQHRAFRGEL